MKALLTIIFLMTHAAWAGSIEVFIYIEKDQAVLRLEPLSKISDINEYRRIKEASKGRYILLYEADYDALKPKYRGCLLKIDECEIHLLTEVLMLYRNRLLKETPKTIMGGKAHAI